MLLIDNCNWKFAFQSKNQELEGDFLLSVKFHFTPPKPWNFQDSPLQINVHTVHV